jgi:phage-related protein (TIGR01555 family)
MAKKKRVNVQRFAATARENDIAERQAAEAARAKTQDSFVNYEQNMGIGANNAMSSSTYGFNPITRQRTLLEWIYRGSWLGGVAVDVKADDMTRGGVDLLGELDPNDVQIMEEEAVTTAVWDKINETIKWAGLYGGSLAVILIDGQDNETPLRLNTIRKGQFCGLLSLDRWMVEPTLYDLVTDYGPNLGLPKYYRVTAMAPALVNQRIHYSRVIRFEGIKLPYWQRVMENLWGLSVLERMYDRMVAFDSATTGAAQLVYKSYLRNYKIKNLRQIVAAGGDALVGLSAYVDMMRRFQGIEGMTLLDSEDEFTADSHGSFGGLSDILTRFMEQCSGALQIPLVRLFGQSPSGFSTGETDLRNYYDTVKQSQEKDLKVGITKVYRAMAASLDIQLPEGFGISFRSLWQLTDAEKSDIASKNIDTISKADESGLIDRATALKELKQQSKTTGIFTNITEEQIEEAENEPPPMPEDNGGEEESRMDIGNNSELVSGQPELRAEQSEAPGKEQQTGDSQELAAAGTM